MPSTESHFTPASPLPSDCSVLYIRSASASVQNKSTGPPVCAPPCPHPGQMNAGLPGDGACPVLLSSPDGPSSWGSSPNPCCRPVSTQMHWEPNLSKNSSRPQEHELPRGAALWWKTTSSPALISMRIKVTLLTSLLPKGTIWWRSLGGK